jgi:BolA protein
MSSEVVDRMTIIENKLSEALNPTSIEVIDDSAHHVGHAGSQEGAGHYTVIIESKKFIGLSTLKKHQLVYKALGNMIPDEIHALQIRANAPEE